MSEGAEREESVAAALNPLALPLRQQLGVLGVLLLGAAPFFVETLTVLKLTGALYLAVFAMTWDFTSGYTGEISFGHAFFFAIGGYTTAVLTTEFSMGIFVSVVVGMILAAVGGLLLGGPALRLEGPYLSLITLAAPLILLQLFIVFSGTFGGEVGIIGVPSLFTEPMPNYYLAFGLFTGVLVLFFLITRSEVGRVFTAIREDEDAVVASGLNPAKYKLYSFVLSAAIGGLAGALFVHSNVGTATPGNLVALAVNINIIAATVIGGMGTIVGAAVGGLFFFMFRDYLSNVDTAIPLLDTSVAHFDLMLFYSATVLMMFFLPQGFIPYFVERGRGLVGTSESGGGPAAAEGDGSERTPLGSATAKFRRGIERITGGDRE